MTAPVWTHRCHRCGAETNVHTMSMFNTALICPDCQDRERQHPLYAAARDAETQACLRGDFHFQGIGAPADLKPKEK